MTHITIQESQEYGNVRRRITDPALLAAFQLLTGRTTVREGDITALVTLGLDLSITRIDEHGHEIG
jgi:hypothetical protein